MWAFLVVIGLTAVMFVRWRRSGQRLTEFLALELVRWYARLWHGMVSNGRALVPARGPAILYANHTCSADPAFLQAGCPRPVSFLLAREYYEIGHFRPLFERSGCVPVSRNGQDVCAIRRALRRLSEGRILCIFPEGGLSNAGRNRLRPSKAGVALLALRSRAPVYPAFIADGPQISEVLPAWLRPSRVRVTFGPPVDLSAYYDRPINRKLLEEVTALLMDHVRTLGTKPPARARLWSASSSRRQLDLA